MEEINEFILKPEEYDIVFEAFKILNKFDKDIADCLKKFWKKYKVKVRIK